MLALGIRYLNGWATAADVADRDRVEWPPHPGRVFMALASAHFLASEPKEEKEALEWLEALDPPEIWAEGCEARSVVTQYVPVNDKAGPSKAFLQSAAGLTRERQPRTFARAWLKSDTVWLIWPKIDATPESVTALANLCARVTRIGHSSSLVQVWVSDTVPSDMPVLEPNDSRADRRLRVPVRGTLAYLKRQYNGENLEAYGALKIAQMDAPDNQTSKQVRAELRKKFNNQPPVSLRPELSRWQGYAPLKGQEKPEVPGTFFNPNPLVFQLKRVSSTYRSLELGTTLRLTALFRKALIETASQQGRLLPESVIGHKPDGKPADSPHVAMLPLAYVGSEHADGKLMGLALALPRELPTEERRVLLATLHQIRELRLGPLGVWKLEGLTQDHPPYNLVDTTWTAFPKGATEWGTVTPVVLDRHPKAKDPAAHRREVIETIQKACERIGAPTPVHILPGPVSPLLGVPTAPTFPRLERKDGSELRHTHATLVFDEPVVGPVLLGAGRYRGYGFCRPIPLTST